MAHYPLNHHLRQTYRFFAALTGLYLLVFGAIGLGTTWGEPFFNRGSDWVLGLRTNPATAWLDTLIGVIVLAGILIGGNVYHRLVLVLGWGVCGFAVLVMAFLQTDANVVNASMINIVVWIVAGLILLAAGLYGKVGTEQAAEHEAAAAHGPH